MINSWNNLIASQISFCISFGRKYNAKPYKAFAIATFCQNKNDRFDLDYRIFEITMNSLPFFGMKTRKHIYQSGD